ncbi:hypothetical protein [Qipengyuania soli]|uniref:Uncharacterized protein n=1 Tax=Qipengyuania soli TaxID=2782568 RepID=A0A7S8IVF7_9SPHN|nr:hypothetical protein [Qipengyuania soli]QPC98761.1 hypothetical protein IRL76_13125 [Qipengyuania soli]
MKPASVKKFDMLYLGSVAVGLVGVALNYGNIVDAANAEMAAQGLEATMGGGVIVVSLLFGVVISLALWFLVSVLRIEMVKWIIALFTGWSVVSYIVSFDSRMDLSIISGLVSTVMTVAAIYFLFRPDAKAWFAEKRGA